MTAPAGSLEAEGPWECWISGLRDEPLQLAELSPEICVPVIVPVPWDEAVERGVATLSDAIGIRRYRLRHVNRKTRRAWYVREFGGG